MIHFLVKVAAELVAAVVVAGIAWKIRTPKKKTSPDQEPGQHGR
jgi:hypothetical protein